MKVSVYQGNKIFETQEWPKPSPRAGEVLVKIKSVGICGSDVLGYLGKTQNRKAGIIMGHEAAGIIAELGEGVTNWNIGDRVAIYPGITCGECEYCRKGIRHMCARGLTLGSSRGGFQHGAMCEYMVLPAKNHLMKLDDRLSFDIGALADPLGNVAHVMDRVKLKAGSTVAIMGVGSIGLIALQMAKATGAARVIAIDTIDSRLDLAKDLGADETINALKIDTVQEVMRLTNNVGVDMTMNAAGSDISYKNSVLITRKRGTIAAFGYSNPNGDIPIPSESFLFKELTMYGNGGMDDFEINAGLALCAAGKINAEAIITHKYGLDNVTEAFKILTENPKEAIKIMINID